MESKIIDKKMIEDTNKDKKSYYAIIPADVRYDENLCANAKLLYGEITALCNEKGFCWANNEYFATLYKVTKTSISKWISSLEKQDFISIEINQKQGNTRKLFLNRSLRKVKEVYNKSSIPIKEKLYNNNKYNTTLNNKYNINKQSKIAEDKDTSKNNQKQTTKTENPINALIAKFEPINPSFARLFGNKTQRGAIERMIKQHSLKGMIDILDILPKILGKKYAPTISTPLALENKMGDLLQFIKRNNFSTGGFDRV